MKNSSFSLLIITLALLCACQQNPKTMEKKSESAALVTTPKNFVFVPGSFHGAWCWFKMQPLLSKNGNTSTALDLPGHGLDHTPPGGISLADYVDSVCKILEKSEHPVVLVGHSRAGIVLSQVAERMPEKIEQLVYLCAFLIPNGEPMVATALTDSASVLVNGLIFNEKEGWHAPKPEIYREAFYHDCSDEDVALCTALLAHEPNQPVGTPLQLTADRFGRVKKTYIFTTADRAITHDLQKKMVARTPVDRTFELQASHSPFLSRPGELADILIKL